MPADYEDLARRGTSVRGAIVIARYGGSWRGIKPKLAAEKASNLTRVSVATARGNVSLTGIVPTATDRVRAEEIARGVKGVQGVANNLQVEKP